MSYSAVYWRMFMCGEEFPREIFHRDHCEALENVCYPEGPIIYNRYRLSYIGRCILLYWLEQYTFYKTAHVLEHDLACWLSNVSTDFYYKSSTKNASWNGYEDTDEIEDLTGFLWGFSDRIFDGTHGHVRTEDLYGVILDLFFDSVSFIYINYCYEFLYNKFPIIKDKGLPLSYPAGLNVPWNYRISLDVCREELYFAMRLKEILMYSISKTSFGVMAEILELTKMVRSLIYTQNSWENFISDIDTVEKTLLTGKSFLKLMNFADNIFVGQVFRNDRWNNYCIKNHKTIFHEKFDNSQEQGSVRQFYERAQQKTDAYIQQRKDFFDGA